MYYYPILNVIFNKIINRIPGTIKLVPPAFRFDSLRTDYEDMAEMMFGQYPSFDDLMDYIQTLENEINAL